MVKFSEALEQQAIEPNPDRMKFSQLEKLHALEGSEPIESPTFELQKQESRGVLDKVKFFLGETTKAVARGVELIGPGVVGVLELGFQNVRNIAKKSLSDDGAVFGISQEKFESRTPEQVKRIALNNKIVENMDKTISTSKKLKQNWIDATKVGIEAPSEEFLKQSPVPFTENFSFTRMFALGAQSVPMLGLAAAVTAATKSPVAGASVLGVIEAAGEANIAIEKGFSVNEANLVFVSDAIVISALETVPLTSFMKGGTLPVRMFRTGVQEGGEEVLQKLWTDSVAKLGYDDTRVLTEGLIEAFIGGFVSGGVIGAFGPSRDVQRRIKEARKKGVDVDKMIEVASQQVIENADEITSKFEEKVTQESVAPEGVETSGLEEAGEVIEAKKELSTEESKASLNVDDSGKPIGEGRITISSTRGKKNAEETIGQAGNQTGLEGVRQETVDEINNFANTNDLQLTITGLTEAGHLEEGEVTHGNGLKFDIRNTPRDTDTVREIQNIEKINEAVISWGATKERINKKKKKELGYVNPDTGATYWEEENHWDVEVVPIKPDKVDSGVEDTPVDTLIEEAAKAERKKAAKEKEETKSVEDNYKRNFELQKGNTALNKATNLIGEFVSGAQRILDETFGSISTRLANVDESLRDAFRKFEYSTLISEKENLESAKEFVEKFSKLPEEDFTRLDLALKNRDTKTIDRLLKKHNLIKSHKKVRELLDSFPDQAKEVGLQMGFITDYFPRSVKDVKRFLIEIRRNENWNQINEALRNEEKRLGYVLSEDDKARIITQMISGYGDTKIKLGRTRFANKRSINVLSAENNQYYKNSSDALIEYIRSMTALIEGRKFLGRESKEVTDVRTKIKRAKSRVVEITNKDSKEVKSKKLGQLFAILQGLKTDIERASDFEEANLVLDRVESLETFINIVKKQPADKVKQKVLDDINKRLDDLDSQILSLNTNLDEGIAIYVKQLVEDNTISNDQVEEVTNIIRARMNPKGISNPAVTLLKDVTYITVLNDFTNGITQLGDMFLSVYKNNIFFTSVAIGDILSGKADITSEDVGLGDIVAAEFDSIRNRDKVRDFIFKWTGIKSIDKIGKSVFMSAAWKKMQSQAKTADQTLIDNLDRVFGEESKQVLQDIKNGELNFNTKYLLFAALSDVQPVSLSETPENFAKAGNLRILYMLKTFSLKIIDIARNDAYNKIAKGDVKEGVKNLFNLTIVLALMGATVGALKDFILGKPFDLQDDAIDGIGQLIMYNRYIGYRSQQDGFMKTFMVSLLPPLYKLGDDLQRDIQNDREIPKWKSARNFPFIGEPYYWWFGGGVDKKDKNSRKSRRSSRSERKKRRKRR